MYTSYLVNDEGLTQKEIINNRNQRVDGADAFARQLYNDLFCTKRKPVHSMDELKTYLQLIIDAKLAGKFIL